MPSVILEIKRAALKNLIKADQMLGAQFYYILSEVAQLTHTHTHTYLDPAQNGSASPL